MVRGTSGATRGGSSPLARIHTKGQTMKTKIQTNIKLPTVEEVLGYRVDNLAVVHRKWTNTNWKELSIPRIPSSACIKDWPGDMWIIDTGRSTFESKNSQRMPNYVTVSSTSTNRYSWIPYPITHRKVFGVFLFTGNRTDDCGGQYTMCKLIPHNYERTPQELLQTLDLIRFVLRSLEPLLLHPLHPDDKEFIYPCLY